MPSAARESRPAVFLDRDGTIMRDVNYCGDPGQVQVFPETAPALQRLKGAGFDLYIITNQSGIGRGYFTEQDYRAVEAEVERQVGAGLINGTYFCPDAPEDACECRKPSPALIQQAARDHALDLHRSFMIGDKQIDAECGRNAGLRTVLVQTGQEQHDPESAPADWVARDLAEAAEIILRHGV
jgi:D-glycero-D-manno-heptose 1,7-bisphosphate phosphatase